MTLAMAIGREWHLGPFLHRMDSDGLRLHQDEHALLEAAPICQHMRGTVLRHEHDTGVMPWIVGTGWAGYIRTLRNGRRRQILGIALPGDTIGLTGGPLALPCSGIIAITAMQLLDATRLKATLASDQGGCSNIRSAVDRERELQETRLLDHLLRLGQLSASERTAHLLLEIHDRLDRAGLVKNDEFEFHLTQIELGHALGLSLVHVNRTLQALRREGIELKAGKARIASAARLQALSGCYPGDA